MINRVAIHTAPMEVMNQLAAVVVGSMLPLVVNTIRYRNSVMASATVTSGLELVGHHHEPDGGVDEQGAGHHEQPPTGVAEGPSLAAGRERPEREQEQQRLEAGEHQVGGALGARLGRDVADEREDQDQRW